MAATGVWGLVLAPCIPSLQVFHSPHARESHKEKEVDRMGKKTVVVAWKTLLNERDELAAEEVALREFEAAIMQAPAEDFMTVGVSSHHERESENAFTQAIHDIDAALKAAGFNLRGEHYIAGVQGLIYQRDNIMVNVVIYEGQEEE